MVIKKCPICGKEFLPFGSKKYCSLECKIFNKKRRGKERRRFLHKKKERKCLVCGSSIPFCRREYCSDKCRKREYIRQRKKIRDIKYQSKPLKVCIVCGKKFLTNRYTPSIQKYCSGNCASRFYSIRLKELRKERKKKLAILTKCIVCGKNFIRKRLGQIYCSYKCNMRAHSKIYSSDLRNKVLKYLGGKCVYCGCDVRKALQINHINGGGTNKASLAQKDRAKFYRDIIRGEIKDVELTCWVCNSAHYLRLLGITGHKVTWEKSSVSINTLDSNTSDSMKLLQFIRMGRKGRAELIES